MDMNSECDEKENGIILIEMNSFTILLKTDDI